MPKPTRYHYWQAAAYRPVYYVFLTVGDKIAGNDHRIATVRRYGPTWYAIHPTQEGVDGRGKTRDEAVDGLLFQIGGLG